MLNLLINNGQRVDALVNLKIRHIKNAEEKDNSHVAVIAHHKTGHIAPITLVFSEDLLTFMEIYLSKIRPRLSGFNSELEEKSVVFLTYPPKTASPSALNPSSVNKAIKSTWKPAEQTKNISATQLRKATATSVKSKFTLARDVLA
ncbi:uncharacterized protein LOC133175138 [Saccostrea echinata]|uniref:uncharacterized protein LOC133175138 n=1 Tax=Saccostrea echinata TaxID=191078 RepID=UPI002A7FAA68|nr:uncharacterized protein LOC133175138 [Saccostrea echinata]